MIELSSVNARAGTFVLRDINATIDDGNWWLVLGPAGAGKTTLLETVAGVRRVESGRVRLRGVDATGMPPEQRRVGMVYQRGYLFPHLSVAGNLAYGAHGASAPRELAERFGISALLDRPVDGLSGGERQLVALVRALATAPDILLLDEPFSALDPRRRSRVRQQLVQVQRERAITVLQVTHDFSEAGILGDGILVLENGRLAQAGTPDSVFRAPATASVAGFLGAENIIAGRITPGSAESGGTLQFLGEGIQLTAIGTHPGGRGHAVVRGEDITILGAETGASSARNMLSGKITEVALDGPLARISFSTGDTTVTAVITRASAADMHLAVGNEVTASVKATAVHIC